jgi:uncharacterized protein (DUF924 family)
MTASGDSADDDIKGAKPTPGISAETQPAGEQRPLPDSREEWKWLRNVPPPQPVPEETDPFSPAFVRDNIDETAGSILHFWFGKAAEDPAVLHDKQELWFKKSFDTDAIIAARFGDLVAKVASGEGRRWAAKSSRDRLAAIIALDQFTRNIFRGLPEAFENDALALDLCKEALARGEDRHLKPVERWFLLMPLEHSESSTDQKRSVAKFAELAAEAPPAFRGALMGASEYARRHAEVIRRFGRFPHRNEALGRMTTTAEKAFLKQPGSRF